ncbi:hypothetical protein HZB04_01520 [Candidatus Wolfebacteria bacterium]|nr:hypothetical protein [Candidatus Wolfebacteria bacterium]
MKFIKIIIFTGVISAIGAFGYSAMKKTGFQMPLTAKDASTAQKIIKSAPINKQSAITQISQLQTTPKKPSYLPNITDSQIPKGFAREQLSSYFGQIKIYSVSYSSSETTPSEIKINSDFQDKNKSIDISGWKIKSNLRELEIPKAINIYEPSGSSQETDIYFESGNNLNIYSNISPIGKNFRLNKCIGYLENSYKFTPPLSSNCPPIYTRDEIATFAGYCQTYIMSIGSCKLPDTNYYNSLPGTDQGNACRNFLNPISYNGCFQKHRNDSDFLSKEFRTWVNQNTLLDSQHDRLLLFDKNGFLVSEYVY